MRHSVTTPLYLFKKALDNVLYAISSNEASLESTTQSLASVPFPTRKETGWLPLYTMVTFRPDISYAAARKKAAKQSAVLSIAGRLGTVLMSATGLYFTLQALHWMRSR
jgi:kynurenine 3-monooxygenase